MVFETEAYILKKVFGDLTLFEFEAPEEKQPEESPYAKLIPKIIYINLVGLCL